MGCKRIALAFSPLLRTIVPSISVDLCSRAELRVDEENVSVCLTHAGNYPEAKVKNSACDNFVSMRKQGAFNVTSEETDMARQPPIELMNRSSQSSGLRIRTVRKTKSTVGCSVCRTFGSCNAFSAFFASTRNIADWPHCHPIFASHASQKFPKFVLPHTHETPKPRRSDIDRIPPASS